MINIDTLRIRRTRKPHPLDTIAAHKSQKEKFHMATEALKREVQERRSI